MSLPKNLLFIVSGNYISGAEKVTLEVIAGLKKENFEIFCVISGWTDGSFPHALTEMEVPYKAIKLGWYYLNNLRWSLDSLIHYPKAFIQFFNVKNLRTTDFIYTTSFRYIILLFPLLTKKIIYHVHDPNSFSRQFKFFLNIADRKVLKYIAVSNFIKKDLILCGIEESKIEVIYNGIEVLPPFSSMPAPKISLGIVGQIIARKGHEDVLNALKILKDRNQDILLIIAGKGNNAFIEKLKKIILQYDLVSRVEWRPFSNSIYDIYKNIDVLVAPTRNDEPFALVALEANMLCIPVIATNKGGFPESILNNENGFLIEAYNTLQLAERVEFFQQRRTMIKQFGEAGRRRVIKNFNKDMMIDKIKKLLISLTHQ